MRIFFIGTVRFSFDCLNTLIDIGAEVVGVATKKASRFHSDHLDLAPLCVDRGIPFVYANDINSEEILSFVKQTSADVIYCFGWSSLIKKDLLQLCKLGVVGYHPAALPNNRGR